VAPAARNRAAGEDARTEAVTGLLIAWSGGDAGALDRLVPRVYRALRRIAANRLRGERSDHSLDSTALVHEAYLKLVDQRRVSWRNRAQFFAVAARLMRRILVDHARRRKASVRGALRVTLTEIEEAEAVEIDDFLMLERALSGLEAQDPRAARVVEARFFVGLTIDETAAVLEISPATVKREWSLARAWLRRELGRSGEDGE
jgi:RNA polymerase sigma factor (TIGR02999 family)